MFCDCLKKYNLYDHFRNYSSLYYGSIFRNWCEEHNIKIGSNVKIGYIPQQINFNEDMTILDYARKYFNGEESRLRSALHKFQFYGENIFKKVKKISGGEKVRLMLFTLIQDNCNFIILDEPTNHIDIPTKETLESALINYEGTILFVSHDRYFINKLANKVLYILGRKRPAFAYGINRNFLLLLLNSLPKRLQLAIIKRVLK